MIARLTGFVFESGASFNTTKIAIEAAQSIANVLFVTVLAICLQRVEDFLVFEPIARTVGEFSPEGVFIWVPFTLFDDELHKDSAITQSFVKSICRISPSNYPKQSE